MPMTLPEYTAEKSLGRASGAYGCHVAHHESVVKGGNFMEKDELDSRLANRSVDGIDTPTIAAVRSLQEVFRITTALVLQDDRGLPVGFSDRCP